MAGQTFITKVSTAMGTWLAAAVLTAIHFPRAGEIAIDTAVLWRLGAIYFGVMTVLGILSVLFMKRYRITRSGYLAVLQDLKGS